MSRSMPLLKTAPESSLVYETDSVRSAFLAILDAVRIHPFAVVIEADLDKLKNPVTKFVIRYPELLRDKFFAYRLRKSGEASHKLVIYRPKKDGGRAFLVLLSSHPDSHEKWIDVRERKSRLIVFDYELVRVTKEGQSAPVWTWRIAGVKYDAIREAIKIAVDNKYDDKLAIITDGTRKWPGFHEVRNQHYELGEFLRERWKRTRTGDPPIWPRLPYVTRRSTPVKKLSHSYGKSQISLHSTSV